MAKQGAGGLASIILTLLVVMLLSGCNTNSSGSGDGSDTDRENSEPVMHEFEPGEPFGIRAMWVWGSSTVLNESTQSELLDFAESRRINRLYAEAESLVVNNQWELAEFIKRSKARGIEVELLFGMREWAFYENHYKVLNLADHVIDFTRRYPEARPAAMHLDVEPYSLPEWEDDHNSIANQKIELYEKVRERLGDIDMPLVVDIPVWFDRVDVTRDGVTRPLHKYMIDVTDGVVLMDYRNTYDRIVNDARPELEYASLVGKPLVIGVETLCIEPDSITFCGIGRNIMEEKLARLDQEMPGEYSGYGGQAIHHFISYRDLEP